MIAEASDGSRIYYPQDVLIDVRAVVSVIAIAVYGLTIWYAFYG